MNPRRRLRPLLLGCLIIPALVCAVGGYMVHRQVTGISSKLPEHVAALKKMGVATEPNDLAPNPPVSPGENAASLYRSLGFQLEALTKAQAKKEQVKLLDAFADPKGDPKNLGSVLAVIQSQQILFSDLHKLNRFPRLDFQRDYKLGFSLLLPEFADQKRLAKWACTEARAKWMTNDRAGAIQSLRTAYRIGEHIQQEPFIIAELVYLSIQAIAHQTLYSFMQEARNDRLLLAQLERMRASVGPAPDIRTAFGGEVVMGRTTIQTLTGKKSLAMFSMSSNGESEMPWLDAMLSSKAVREMYEAKFAEAWLRILKSLPQDRGDYTGMAKAVRAESAKIDSDKSLENILNRILFPVLDQAIDAAANGAAERRLEMLSFRLLKLRPNLPANLSQFGEEAIDPFTGKPFGYKRDGRGFKIWSVGRDRADNGGVARKPNSGSGREGIDLVMGFDIQIQEVVPTKSANESEG